MGLFGPKQSREERFWEWFSRNRSKYASEGLTLLQLKAMEKQLCKVHKDLVWEIGPLPDGRWQIAISADGLRGAAGHARVLADKAPDIEGWEVVAFRQPKRPDSGPIGIQFGGSKAAFSTDTVYATASQIGSVYDLTIYAEFPSDIKEDDVKHVTYLLLDNTIGERAMIYKIRYVDFEPMSKKPENAVSLDELPSIIGITQY